MLMFVYPWTKHWYRQTLVPFRGRCEVWDLHCDGDASRGLLGDCLPLHPKYRSSMILGNVGILPHHSLHDIKIQNTTTWS